jgi:hypothetical protein
MFKSSVIAIIIMTTNIFGGSCSNENVKVEGVTPTNEVVMEEENIIEEYEEIEKMYEQQKIEWEEKVKYEVENNPSFEEDFNKLQEIERNYLNDINNKRGLENHTYAELDEIRRGYNDCLEKGLNEVELEEGSILNELRSSMILYYKWDYCDSMDKMNDLEEIIRLYI